MIMGPNVHVRVGPLQYIQLPLIIIAAIKFWPGGDHITVDPGPNSYCLAYQKKPAMSAKKSQCTQHELTLFRYDVMGEKVGTKWRKYVKTCMFSCYRIKQACFHAFMYKTCVFSCILSI